MKFDAIIGNPPYSKNLHLKIINDCLEMLNISGYACFIHPAGWLEDLIWDIKGTSTRAKYQNLVSKISNVEIYKEIDIRNYFSGAALHSDFLISIFNDTPCKNIDDLIFKNYDIARSIVNKCVVSHKVKYMIESFDDSKKYKICIPYIHGHVNSVDFGETMSKDYETALGAENDEWVFSFDTEAERKNFFDSTHTTFHKNLHSLIKSGLHVNVNYLPFMEDYSEKWDDERFCKFFKLNKKEKDFILSPIIPEKFFLRYSS